MEKILELLSERDRTIAKKLVEDAVKEVETKFKKQVAEVGKKEDWEETNISVFKGMFPEFDVEKYVADVEFDPATEIITHATEAVQAAKEEAIPEELKVFYTEDSELNNDLLKDVNTSLEQLATNREFEAFKTTAFAKGLKEGFEITLDKYKELKQNANPSVLEGILSGDVKENAFMGAIFKVVEETPEEEVEQKEETTEERIARLKQEAEVKKVELTPEEQKEIKDHEISKEIEQQIAFLVKEKKERLNTKYATYKDESAKQEIIEKEISEYEAKLKEQHKA